MQHLTSCQTVKTTPTSNNFISVQNPTGVIPKLVHITSDSDSHARNNLGFVLEAWYVPEWGFMFATASAGSGSNTAVMFTPVNQTPTAILTYYLSESTIESYKGDSATGNKWDTQTEYTVEIYT